MATKEAPNGHRPARTGKPTCIRQPRLRTLASYPGALPSGSIRVAADGRGPGTCNHSVGHLSMKLTTTSQVLLVALVACGLGPCGLVLAGGLPAAPLDAPVGAPVAMPAAMPAATSVGAPVSAPAATPAVAPAESLPDFGALLERQSAAVVGVAAIMPSSDDDEDEGGSDDAWTLPPLSSEPHETDRGLPRTAVRDEGCGLIVSRDGYILTSAHLVHGAAWISVRLSDGGEWTARLVGSDAVTDVAVLKIDAHDLHTAVLGDSGQLRPGEWVAAIGAPYGLAGSVAAGVVSALNRTLPGDEYYVPLIQTDLSLNPGNSGGPLFDARGQVVGINSQIVFREGGSAGISFAVPIDVAIDAAEQLIRHGHIERGDIGIAFQDVDGPLARAFGLERPRGALVHTVKRGGPADDAHLKAGDIVLELDGRTIGRASDLAAAIAASRPGSLVTLGVWRNGALEEKAVRVGLNDSGTPTAQPASLEGPPSSFVLITVHQLSERERRIAGTEGYLLVTAVSEQAAAAGIEAGDIVLEAGETELRSVAQLRQALARRSDELPLLIERDGIRTYVALPLRYPQQERSADSIHTSDR